MRRLEKAIRDQAKVLGCEYAILAAIVEVESAGKGFDEKTGKLIIQFEPGWFKRKYANWRAKSTGYAWFTNKVEKQPGEWKAFNSAFAIDKNAAMESTSVGLMQVMGFHYKRLGFRTVGEMWDFAKVSEENQLILGVKFIQTDRTLLQAVKTKNWPTVARIYNGSGYRKFKYDDRLKAAYNRHLKNN